MGYARLGLKPENWRIREQEIEHLADSLDWQDRAALKVLDY